MIVETRHRLLSVALLMSCGAAAAANTASYSYRQVNEDFNQQEVIHSDSVGPEPIPLSVTEMTPNSTFVFDVSGLQTNTTSLSARAFFSADVDQLSSAEAWKNVEASAVAEASLVDLVTVQGAAGIPGGEVIFHWTVQGNSELTFDKKLTSDLIAVDDLTSSLLLRSTIPNSGGVLISDTHSYPDTGSFPVASGALIFPVPWVGGAQMPIVFDLIASTSLMTRNLDARGFKAVVDVNASNTAELLGVAVFDPNGVRLPDATIVSDTGFEYPTVPEPSCWFLLVSSLLIFSFWRVCLRIPRAARQDVG